MLIINETNELYIQLLSYVVFKEVLKEEVNQWILETDSFETLYQEAKTRLKTYDWEQIFAYYEQELKQPLSELDREIAVREVSSDALTYISGFRTTAC